MPSFNDLGIVLNSFDYGETDKILHIYTQKHGLISAICKGIKKPTSKFHGKIDVLSCSYFQFGKGKNLNIISDCKQVNAFLDLRENLHRLSFGLLFLELVYAFAHENDLDSEMNYTLLYEGLNTLQKVDNPDLFSIDFIINFLKDHGYKPQCDHCVMCSERVLEEIVEYAFSSTLGGIICDKCSKQIDHTKMHKNIFKIINQENKIEEKISFDDIRTALRFLKDHISARIHNDVKSFDLVFSL